MAKKFAIDRARFRRSFRLRARLADNEKGWPRTRIDCGRRACSAKETKRTKALRNQVTGGIHLCFFVRKPQPPMDTNS